MLQIFLFFYRKMLKNSLCPSVCSLDFRTTSTRTIGIRYGNDVSVKYRYGYDIETKYISTDGTLDTNTNLWYKRETNKNSVIIVKRNSRTWLRMSRESSPT